MSGKIPHPYFSALSSAEQAEHPLFQAVNNSDRRAVRKLLEDLKTPVDCLYSSESPLFWAVIKRDIAVVKLLLKHKASVNLQNVGGSTPLMLAAQDNYPDIVRLLISHGAEINIQDNEGFTPLMWAVPAEGDSDLKVIKLLCGHGAKVNITSNKGVSALLRAAMYNCINVVQFLVDHGADIINIQTTDDGHTLLTTAAASCSPDMLKLLVNLGAQVNAHSTNYGLTAVMIAVMKNTPDAVKALIRNGAQINTQEFLNKATALMLAALSNKSDMVQTLVTLGANINIQDKDGGTALMYAVCSNCRSVVQLLIGVGADIDLKNSLGRTALDLATENNNGEVAKILRDHLNKMKAERHAVEDSEIDDMLKFLANNCPKSYETMKKKISMHALKSDVVALEASGNVHVSTEYQYFTCFNCTVKDQEFPLKKCVKCKVARYCVVDCQRKDWPDHKKWCKDVVSYRSSIVDLEASKLRRKAADLSISETKESDETSKVSEESNETARDLPKKEGKKSKGKCCLYCHKVKSAGHPIRKCICKAVRYCSQECHEKDWENHKQHCLEIRAREKNDDNTEKNDKKMFDIDDVD